MTNLVDGLLPMKGEAFAVARSIKSCLFVTILISFCLRVWGNVHGLPEVYHPDEGFEVYRALRLGMGDFDNSIFGRVTKSGYYYLLFFEFCLYYLFLFITGVTHSTKEFADLIIRDPTVLWLIGRTTTALIGTVNVYFVYRLTSLVQSPYAGVVSALILGCAYLHVVHSHYITVDIPMTCLVTITLYYVMRILRYGLFRDYLLGGIFAGFSAMVKLPGVLVLVPLGLAHLFMVLKNRREVLSWTSHRLFVLALVVMAGVYSLGNPRIFWSAGSLIAGLAGQFGGQGWHTGELRGAYQEFNHWVFYFDALVRGVGFPLLLIGAIGLGFSLWQRRQEFVILGLFIAVFFIVLSLSNDPTLVYSRYVLPIIPPLVICAAMMVDEFRKIMTQWPLIQIVGQSVVIVGVLLPNVVQSVQYDHRHTRVDTRTLAKQWIETHIPAGTKILLQGNPEDKSQLLVPLESDRASLRQMAKEREKDNPGKTRYLKIRAAQAEEPGYQLITVRHFRPFDSWDVYKSAGVKVIIMKGYSSYPLEQQGKTNDILKARLRLEQDLRRDPEVQLVAVFDPKETQGPGPILRIYHVKE